jgi:hypothetical protein
MDIFAFFGAVLEVAETRTNYEAFNFDFKSNNFVNICNDFFRERKSRLVLD